MDSERVKRFVGDEGLGVKSGRRQAGLESAGNADVLTLPKGGLAQEAGTHSQSAMQQSHNMHHN